MSICFLFLGIVLENWLLYDWMDECPSLYILLLGANILFSLGYKPPHIVVIFCACFPSTRSNFLFSTCSVNIWWINGLANSNVLALSIVLGTIGFLKINCSLGWFFSCLLGNPSQTLSSFPWFSLHILGLSLEVTSSERHFVTIKPCLVAPCLLLYVCVCFLCRPHCNSQYYIVYVCVFSY